MLQARKSCWQLRSATRALADSSRSHGSDRRSKDRPDAQLTQGLAMISQGLAQVGQALINYGLPTSSIIAKRSTDASTAMAKPSSDLGIANLCVIVEGLRQLIAKTIEYNLRQVAETAPLHEPIKPAENFVKVSQPRQETPSFESISTNEPILGTSSKAKRVPATRLGRALSYGTMFAGLGIGAAQEALRRVTSNEKNNPLLLNEANANRLVDTLCQMRGAALKIGQILSLQDIKLVPKEIQQLFIRVRDQAHYMPVWQLDRVMTREWGDDWRSRLDYFDDKPFAAASIGQVHRGVFEGQEVAIKVQYPGVASGINADIDNLMMLLRVWDLLPKGMFINNLVEVARRELAWEVDYIREAAAGKKFKELLKNEDVFLVPEVIDELTTKSVLVTELVKGVVPVDRLSNASQPLRNYVAENLLRLTLNEIFVYRYMQTDPNWSNFLYQPKTQRIVLLDFGSSRPYEKSFMDTYIKVIEAAAVRDEEKILELSRTLGFLTGQENETMKRAHCDAVLTLGVPFTVEEFDFSQRQIEEKVAELIPVMLKYRLTAPPEAIYSLHRKLSGIYLLCTKLRAKIDCRSLFNEAREKYYAEEQLGTNRAL